MRVIAILVSALFVSAPALADDSELPVKACADAVGTFLFSDAPTGSTTTSRSLIALTNGGHVMFVDSGEAGEPGYAPFSDGLGRWRCLSQPGEDPRLRAVILDFTFAGQGKQQIARVDLDGTLDRNTGILTAIATLSFHPMSSNPVSGDVRPGGKRFNLTGHRIEVP